MYYQIIVLLFLFSSCFKVQSQIKFDKELNLISGNSIKQLETEDKQRFDLSGLVKHNGSVYVVADKDWYQFYKYDDSSLYRQLSFQYYLHWNFVLTVKLILKELTLVIISFV